jgi:hypothetical protein
MSRFVYRVHALQRMFERQIERSVVESVIQSGTTIESYPEDTPYPSRLVLGWDRDRPGMLWSRIIRKMRRPSSLPFISRIRCDGIPVFQGGNHDLRDL